LKLRHLVLSLLLVAAHHDARAQEAARDPAQAEALFQAALDLLKNNDWSGACPKFEQSMKLDPSVGALLNVGRCQEHAGKLASAWATYTSARSLNMEGGVARNAQVDQFLSEQLAKIAPRLPRLVVQVAGRPVGLKVRRGDVEIASESLGAPIPVDPGQHEVVASAPGYLTVQRRVDAREGATTTIEIKLDPAPITATKPPGPPALGAPETRKGSSFGARAKLGVVVGGAGLAALTVSAVTGALALAAHAKLSELDESGACTIDNSGGTTRRLCDAGALLEARDQSDRGAALAAASTATLVAGSVLTAVGVTLVLTDRRDRPSVGLVVAPLPASPIPGLAVGGRF
jgi:hypothetical protein